MGTEKVVILNDFSLSGQFATIEDFYDSLYKISLPAWDLLEKQGIIISCGQQLYDLPITEKIKLMNILQSRGNPEISKLKTLINKGPYWDDNSNSVTCLHEASKQETAVFSFEHEEYKNEKILGRIFDCTNDISNIFTKPTALRFLNECLLITDIKKIELMYPQINFVGNYFDKMCEEESLSKKDRIDIVAHLEKFIHLLLTNKDVMRYSKTIDGDLKEFRITISGNEIRIFYFFKSGRYIFINGFMKKTQKTPKYEIDKAKRIKSEV